MPMMLPATVPPLERDLLLSAAPVSLALFGASVSCADIKTVDVSTPKMFMGLKGQISRSIMETRMYVTIGERATATGFLSCFFTVSYWRRSMPSMIPQGFATDNQ
ncbi:putative inorganic diphosphatase [Helianthus annuus]|nr:putative inorganic diphosphatase [Helianthus annuus]